MRPGRHRPEIGALFARPDYPLAPALPPPATRASPPQKNAGRPPDRATAPPGDGLPQSASPLGSVEARDLPGRPIFPTLASPAASSKNVRHLTARSVESFDPHPLAGWDAGVFPETEQRAGRNQSCPRPPDRLVPRHLRPTGSTTPASATKKPTCEVNVKVSTPK